MLAKDIQSGDQYLDNQGMDSRGLVYTVLSVRAMKIDGKAAIAVVVRYFIDSGEGTRYFYEDDDVPLTRPADLTT